MSIAGCTSLVQPMDVCFNRPFKAAIEKLATQHMQDNLQAYVNGELNASNRRVLFTKWVGEAWEEVSTNKDMVVRSFKKSGITFLFTYYHVIKLISCHYLLIHQQQQLLMDQKIVKLTLRA